MSFFVFLFFARLRSKKMTRVVGVKCWAHNLLILSILTIQPVHLLCPCSCVHMHFVGYQGKLWSRVVLAGRALQYTTSFTRMTWPVRKARVFSLVQLVTFSCVSCLPLLMSIINADQWMLTSKLLCLLERFCFHLPVVTYLIMHSMPELHCDSILCLLCTLRNVTSHSCY